MTSRALSVSYFTLRVAFLDLLLFAILLFIYNSYIAVIFGYEGFIDNLNWANLPLSLLLLLICVFSVGKQGTTSNFFLHFTVSSMIVPSLVLYCGGDLSFIFPILTCSAFVIIAYFVNFITLPSLNFEIISFDRMTILLTVSSSIFVAAVYAVGGSKYINFDISLIYLLRREAAEELPGIFSYLTPLFSHIVIPTAIVFITIRRQWFFLFILSGCSVMMFAMTAHKSPLFYPPFLIFMYWTAQSKKLTEYFLMALLGGIFIGAFDLSIFIRDKVVNEGYGWVGGLLIERILLVPSHLNWEYFDYFSVNEQYYWSQSKVSFGLVEKPGSLDMVESIAFHTRGNLLSHPNVGWIGSGYGHAGFTGVYIYSVIIGGFLSFLDMYAKKHGNAFIIATFIITMSNMFTSSDLTTVFLTHGAIVAILILMLTKPLPGKTAPAVGRR